MRSPASRIALSTARVLLVLGTLLFLAAGTLRFWQAWAYLALNLAGMATTNRYLLANDPALLERRLVLEEQGESSPVQRRVMGLMRLDYAAMMVIAGLDRRYAWSVVPVPVVVAAWVLFAAGSLLILRVFRENTHASSVIEIGAGQTVVTTGPYRFVRHPMYVAALVMALATPLSLGSTWGLLTFVPCVALVVGRLLDEERLLSDELPGYRQYMQKTRGRLLPGVW